MMGLPYTYHHEVIEVYGGFPGQVKPVDDNGVDDVCHIG